jgi:glycerol-3-phosphate dehydrogenase
MKRNLEKLANQTFDVLVIGGGIHGAVAAWDAVLRGLSVALIERGDFGGATSQNSLKIVHGGLRYLQDGNLARIRTMARERTTWMRIAPHLVHPLTCLTPTRKKLSRSRLALGVAMTANDLLSFDRNRLPDAEKHLANGKLISQRELADILPAYEIDASTGAAVWRDAQIHNTERLLLEFILSAVNAGAEVANYVEAIGLVRQGDQIIGVQVKDVQSGQVFDIQSKMVVNCAGAWIEDVLAKVSLRSNHVNSVAMNIVVKQVWGSMAAGLPSQPKDGRLPQILFFVPWRDKTMIGTWHIPWNAVPDQFRLTKEIVQDFIDEINSAHPPLELTLDDVQHVTWGFLPVNKENADKSQVKLTRDGVVIDHQKKDNIAGLISVLGVKYTTARFVAEQAIDRVVEKLATKAKKCQTHLTPINGGQIDDFKAFLNQAQSATADLLDAETAEHLAYAYGSEYSTLVQSITAQPETAERIAPDSPVTAAEVIHSIRNEMALTLADVIQRRTELGSTGLPSMAVLQKCAEIMGEELGWSLEKQTQEIESVIQKYSFNNRPKGLNDATRFVKETIGTF